VIGAHAKTRNVEGVTCLDFVFFLTTQIFWLEIIVYSDSSVLKQTRIKLLSHLINDFQLKQHTENRREQNCSGEHDECVFSSILQITKWYFAPFENITYS